MGWCSSSNAPAKTPTPMASNPPRCNALLYAPQYRPNMSSMIRSAEFFGLQKLYIYDANGLLDPPNNKTSRADMNHLARVWTAGAIEYITIEKVTDIEAFLAGYPGRKVATLLDASAQHLAAFQFQPDDLILFGPEREGLPAATLTHIDQRVYLPAHGHTPCLNVAVTFGIVLHAAVQQLAPPAG